MFKVLSESGIDSFGKLFFDVSVIQDEKVIAKRLSLEDYRTMINLGICEDTSFIEAPKLPEHVHKAFIAGNGVRDTFVVILNYERDIRPFSFLNQFLMLPFPSMVFRLEVKKGKLMDKKVFCYTGNLDDYSELYYYPFGNVNMEGSICMGNIGVHIETVEESEKFMELFISGRTNNDYCDKRNALGISQEALIGKIKKKKQFPEKLLKPAGKKLRDLYVY